MKEKQPKLVFLIEILVKVGRLEGLKRRLGMEGCFVVDPISRRGFGSTLEN